jgi:hypothetical protein
VRLSDSVTTELQDAALDEFLGMVSAFRTALPAVNDKQPKLDQQFINLGVFVQRPDAIIRSGEILKIAQNCEFKCSHCADSLKLSRIYRSKDIIVGLSEGHFDAEDVRPLCNICVDAWKTIMKEAAKILWRTKKWRCTPLHYTSGERARSSAIRTVLRRCGKLPRSRVFGVDNVASLIKMYPTVRL